MLVWCDKTRVLWLQSDLLTSKVFVKPVIRAASLHTDLVTATANIQLRKRLRSVDTNRYEPFTTRLKFGKRCFSHAGPKAWNALPAVLQDLTDHSAFKRQLKTFLFERTFTSLHECLAAGHFKCVSAGPCGLDWIGLEVDGVG